MQKTSPEYNIIALYSVTGLVSLLDTRFKEKCQVSSSYGQDVENNSNAVASTLRWKDQGIKWAVAWWVRVSWQAICAGLGEVVCTSGGMVMEGDEIGKECTSHILLHDCVALRWSGLVQGGGAAHTLEKVVLTMAKETIIIVDETKIVPKLGVSFPVPVEVLPQAVAPVLRSLVAIGAGGCPVLTVCPLSAVKSGGLSQRQVPVGDHSATFLCWHCPVAPRDWRSRW